MTNAFGNTTLREALTDQGFMHNAVGLVRTAQLWEEKRGLPVCRLPGPRGRVSITIPALESWKQTTTADAPPVAPPGAGSQTGPFSRRIALWASVGILLAVLSRAAIAVLVRPPQPASFRIERDTLLILDKRGRELWRKSFPGLDQSAYVDYGQRFVWFGDLEGDGKIEVLFVPLLVGQASRTGPLLCYSSSGEERWRFLPNRPVRSRGEEFSPPFWIESFAVAPLARDGSLRVLVRTRHHIEYPMQIALLGPDGRVLREYWHSGYLEDLLFQDLDGDGRPEIILGGISNGSKRATLVILDSDEFAGASIEENPDYQLLGFAPGVEKARLLFPRSCINKALEEPYNLVEELFPEQGGVTVAVEERPGPLPPVAYYHLDRQLRLRQVNTSSTFVRVHASCTRPDNWITRTRPKSLTL